MTSDADYWCSVEGCHRAAVTQRADGSRLCSAHAVGEASAPCDCEPLMAQIRAVVTHMEVDARRVALEAFLWVAARLQAKRAEHGDLNLARDHRDFAAEAADEAVDFIAYSVMDRLHHQGRIP